MKEEEEKKTHFREVKVSRKRRKAGEAIASYLSWRERRREEAQALDDDGDDGF